MIRKILPLAACIIIASTSRAQVYVGPDDENVTRPRKVSPELLDALSKTTTVVFIPNAEADLAADLAAKLKKVWTLSPVEVHPISDRDGLGLKFYEPSGYSTAQLHEETYAMVREGAHGARDLGHTSYFTFRIVNRVPKKDWSTDQLYAEVQVHANAMTSMLAAHGSDDQQPDPYAPGNIADFGAGFILVWMHLFNDALRASTPITMGDKVTDTQELKALKQQKLYIVDNVKLQFNGWKGVDTQRDDLKEVLAAYPFDHELISGPDLSKLLLSSEGPIYFLTYTRSAAGRFVNVYRSDTGKMIYARVESGRNFERDDLEDLVKAMSKE